MNTKRGSVVQRAALLACIEVSDCLLKQLKNPASGVVLASGSVLPGPTEHSPGPGWVIVIYAVDDDADDALVEAVVGRYA